MFTESLYRHSHRKVGLSRTRRADAEDNGIILYRIDIALLSHCSGTQYLSRCRNTYTVASEFFKLFLHTVSNHRGNIPYSLFTESVTRTADTQKRLQSLFSIIDIAFLTYKLYSAIPADCCDTVVLLDTADIAVKLAEQR